MASSRADNFTQPVPRAGSSRNMLRPWLGGRPRQDPIGAHRDAGWDAFISYRRTDKWFADIVEQRLERFVPPKGHGLPSRELRVFLDESDLRGGGYNEAIRREVERSRSMIVVCSPAARASPYVDAEIRDFIAARRDAGEDIRIAPLLIDGLPNNEAQDLADDSRKAFPEALYEASALPLAKDFRGFEPKGMRLDRGGYSNAWFSTLATILNVDRVELEERQRKRDRQRRRAIGATAGLIGLALAGLAAVAWWQRGAAIEAATIARANESRALAALSEGATSQHRHVDAVKLALASWPRSADGARPRCALRSRLWAGRSGCSVR
jgi:hypothetical protein